MAIDVEATGRPRNSSGNQVDFKPWVALLVVLGCIFYVFNAALAEMVGQWDRDEYSHGYMIPLVAAFLFWQKINPMPAVVSRRGAWWGIPLVVGGFLLFLVGELSAMFTIQQYGFLAVLVGVFVSFFGLRATLLVWAAFAYLIFMVPLPAFIYKSLSSGLQLISSQLGVAVIRLFDISVYLEGNVIDLGSYQLQVVEACSGLRYLFPLMSFGFLIAYLYRGPTWQKWFLFLSTVPITVLMNSFRIGVIGVTVEHWGIAMAEGFLHDFEGWVVFMACLAVLFIEIWIFRLFAREKMPVLDTINLDFPSLDVGLTDFRIKLGHIKSFILVALVTLIVLPVFGTLAGREEKIPERVTFSEFPLVLGSWVGREVPLADTADRRKALLDSLDLTDYFSAEYSNRREPAQVGVWIAFYNSQAKGSAIHSPRTCIPGGGWEIASLEEETMPSVTHISGKPLKYLRLMVRKGESASLVYYWFDGRNRNSANEFEAKWEVFLDSLLYARTDGALVRFITPVGIDNEENIARADQRLQEFIELIYPEIDRFVPAALTNNNN